MFNNRFVNKKLPLVEFAKTLYPQISLQNTCVISIQHLLETTHTMFQSWLELGLKPENIHVLGKCYSTNLSVAARMASDGFGVSHLSTHFNSHHSYDGLFNGFVSKFLEETLSKIDVSLFQKIVLLDDGGHLISSFNKGYSHLFHKTVAIEQTTSGYDTIKTLKLNFPVVNVARSPVKLKYECPMVANVVVQRLSENLKLFKKKPKNILIIGYGCMGSALDMSLKDSYHVTTYDKADTKGSTLEEVLPQADLVVGCTGTTSVPVTMHHLIKKGCFLMSASSSDREFDSVYIRKKVAQFYQCHQHVDDGCIVLLNSGFPVNFDGKKHSVAPEKIQLIRALLTLGLLQSHEFIEPTYGLIELDMHRQKIVLDRFLLK